MHDENQPSYWLDQVVSNITKVHPTGTVVVSSGISPSGPYHIGHAREILTADAICRGLLEAGRKVQHLHFVDSIEVLRKRYPYLPESYEAEAGKPLFMVPAPDGKSSNYATQYFSDYLVASKKLGVDMEIMWTNELYIDGQFRAMINLCMKKRNQIAEILYRISTRKVTDGWQPIQILDESSGKLNTAQYLGYDFDSATAHYLGSDGREYFANASKGQIKLDWRLDWPARWKLYGVMVEGFGREHATKGGSFDTGEVLAKEIFGIEPPLPVPYDNISFKGDNRKMSSSLGNLVTLLDSLKIIPPEILRYFIFKSRPSKQLSFDPGMGLYNLIDEYAKTELATLEGNQPEFKRAWQVASLAGQEHIVSTVAYSHLVMAYQTARGDINAVLDILRRTGHERAVTTQHKAIVSELNYVASWLESYAPEDIKFSVCDSLPDITLTNSDKSLLGGIHSELVESDMSPEIIHGIVYKVAEDVGVKPADAFRLIYQLFINKQQGPKIGFFLSSLDKDFVLNRLARKS